MKRILYLVHRNPAPPNRGHRIRAFNWLDYLARRAEVDLAFLADEPVDDRMKTMLRARCRRFAFAPPPGKYRYLKGLLSLAMGRTATEGLFKHGQLRRLIRRWTAETDYDAVIVYCSSMVQYADAAKLWRRCPVIVDLVDVDSQKWFDYAEKTGGLFRPLFELEGRRLRKLERSLTDRAAAICLVSEAEADVYRSFTEGGRVTAVENGVDLEYFSPHAHFVRPPNRPKADRAVPGCVFIGALDYRANVDGVCWFVRHVWPEIRVRFPNARFRLVGAGAGAAIAAVARREGVELVGDVPDVRPYLADATAAVIPLRVARGVQNKVLEAMAMGKPVVASPEALEGIACREGEDVCRADTPSEWVAALERIFRDDDFARSLGAKARRTMESHYTWSARLAPLNELLGLALSEV
ncbi:TIGR03087 family PEP-CTERM/XrtA system glycosyltransferase [Thermostilla marina]